VPNFGGIWWLMALFAFGGYRYVILELAAHSVSLKFKIDPFCVGLITLPSKIARKNGGKIYLT